MSGAGADAPMGPGWWQASDGRYYPPELAPDARAADQGQPAATPAKKKVVKKVAARPAGEGAPRKKVVKKVAARPSQAAAALGASGSGSTPASEAGPPADNPPVDDAAADEPAADEAVWDDELDAGFSDKRPGQMKYTARAPASDQIAARRIQAKEQMVLLAGERQQAALRALASLGAEEPALVGVGARSLDARSGEVRGTTTEARLAPDPQPSAPPAAPPTPATPAAAPPPAAPPPAAPPPAAPPPAAPPPAAAPPVASPPARSPAPTQGAPAPTPGAADDAGTAPATPVVTPHQPLRGPSPAPAPMGTDVPFMEVKGSALGTDIDRIGEKVLIFADRVELRDRNNAVRQTIRYDQLAAVEVQKKIMGPSLLITSAAGATMTVKALRSPELASGAKAMIEKHAARYRGDGPPAAAAPSAAVPPAEVEAAPEEPTTPAAPDVTPSTSSTPPTSSTPSTSSTPAQTPAPPEDAPAPVSATHHPEGGTHHSVLLAMLEELHEAGILSDEELETKRALIEWTPRH